MTTDRTTKALLLVLVLGVWGLLLRPVFTPEPAKAQGVSGDGRPALAIGDRAVYVAEHGRLYKFFPDRFDRPAAIASYGPNVQAKPD